MIFTLSEALRQIDPHVLLDDGVTARTVEQIIFSVGHDNQSEYFIGVDSLGRFVIFEIDCNGFPVFPAAFVEKKRPPARITDDVNVRSETSIHFLPSIS